MSDEVSEEVQLGNDWDAAHRALIYAYRRTLEDIEQLEEQESLFRGRADAAARKASAAREDLEEINIAIDRTGYVPPRGFTKWGQRVGSTPEGQKDA